MLMPKANIPLSSGTSAVVKIKLEVIMAERPAHAVKIIGRGGGFNGRN